jgi:Gram-negative bacterial TonB protein C-terminal
VRSFSLQYGAITWFPSGEMRHAPLPGRYSIRRNLVSPLGYGLDQNAIDAARQAKFKPAAREGKPVPVQIDMEMTFKLY